MNLSDLIDYPPEFHTISVLKEHSAPEFAALVVSSLHSRNRETGEALSEFAAPVAAELSVAAVLFSRF